MKRNDTEANRRGERKGGQKVGMNSEPLGMIFISMPLCEMREFLWFGTGLLPGCA